MTTKELLKCLEDLGYETAKNFWGQIEIKFNEEFVAVVNYASFGQIDTQYTRNQELPVDKLIGLLDLLVAYAKTPVEDREPKPKLYQAKHRFLDRELGYLNERKSEPNYYFLSEKTEDVCSKTKFTQKELEGTGVWGSKEWEIIEAEN